jgi:hypothetical protein
MIWKACLESVAALASVLVGAAVSVSAAQAATTAPSRIDFETGTIETPPPGFTAGLTGKGSQVRWVVLEDPSAPAGPKVLAETSGDSTSNRFPLAILDGFEAKDVEVSVGFKPVAGKVDQAAGLMVRLTMQITTIPPAPTLLRTMFGSTAWSMAAASSSPVSTYRCRMAAGRP